MNRHLLFVLISLITVSGCANKPIVTTQKNNSPTLDTPISEQKSAPVPVANSADSGSEIVLYALGLLNIDYRFGGNNPDAGLDCSGMTAYIYREALGIKLPHNAAQQSRLGASVNKKDLQPGDLIFFNTNGKSASHVGVYIGENKFVHAPSTNGKIKVTKLSDTYFSPRYEFARRILK